MLMFSTHYTSVMHQVEAAYDLLQRIRESRGAITLTAMSCNPLFKVSIVPYTRHTWRHYSTLLLR
jgi:hypothetical protein